MIKKVLEMAGKKVGLIGTIGAMIGEEHLPSKIQHRNPTNYTACLLPWWRLAANMWSWKFLPRG